MKKENITLRLFNGIVGIGYLFPHMFRKNKIHKTHDFMGYMDKVMERLANTVGLEHDILKLYYVEEKPLKEKVKSKRIMLKYMKKKIAEIIKNELLLQTPELIRLHRRQKSWKIIRPRLKLRSRMKLKLKSGIKMKSKRRLKNVKRLNIKRDLNNRELYDLKLKVDKLHFWLRTTTKKQIMVSRKINKLRAARDVAKHYLGLKKRFFPLKRSLFRRKAKLIAYFLKKRNLYLKKTFDIYLTFYRKLIIFFGLMKGRIDFFKFYFLSYINFYLVSLNKTRLFNTIKDVLNVSMSEVMNVGIYKFRLRRKLRRKLLYYFNVYKNVKKYYKLKVRMVNSNFFITLTNWNNDVLISRSTGQVSGNRKKKVKLSPYLVTRMMIPVLKKLRKLRIKYLFFFINTKINRHIHNVVKMLKNFRYTKVLRVLFSKPVAHHFGTRKPKARRL